MEFEKIRQIIANELSVDPDSISLETSFADDLDADSLELIELIMVFEEEFDKEIPDEVAEKIITVGDAVNFLKDND